MEWESQGILIDLQAYNSDLLVATVLAPNYGIRKGIIKAGKKNKTALNVGNVLDLKWNARLENHLGRFTIQSYEIISSFIYYDRKKIMALLSICSLFTHCLIEKEPQDALYTQLENVLYALKFNNPLWLNMIVLLELELLAKAGFGLELDRCVITGSRDNLKYISPKTGKIVTQEQGEPYKSMLFEVPKLFVDPNEQLHEREIAYALLVTRYFLKRNIFSIKNIRFPNIRIELEEILRKA